MPRTYSAYLLRRWVLADGRERVEVQALPSGESRRCRSLAEAYTWLQGQRDPPGSPVAPSREAGPAAPPGRADAGGSR